MSGFEIAGIVLGAFPIAITTIDSYGKVARTVRAWKDIRVAYTRCSEDLKNEQLVFKRHLRELVLPLVVDGNSANELLADPSSQRWKDADVSELLQKKLGESHILYLGFVRRMEETLAELSTEMALDSDLVQERMDAQPGARPSRVQMALNIENARFQVYKAKFVNGEANRRRLFADLRDCNTKLRELLSSSEKDAELTKQLDAALATSSMDASLCRFWQKAAAFFRALAAACRCQCPSDHAASLLLQHRANCKEKAIFEIVFKKDPGASGPMGTASQEAYYTRIEEHDGHELLKASMVLAPVQQTKIPGYTRPTKAASAKLAVRPKGSTPAITLQLPAKDPATAKIEPIKSLCQSLCGSHTDYRGYLNLPDEDKRYHVYSVAHHVTMPRSVTLAQILNGEVRPPLTRKGSYTVALIIASSFLQLLDSPWLPSATSSRAFDKLSIVFLADPSDPNVFLLNRPQISRMFRELAPRNNSSSVQSRIAPQRSADVSAPLARLGITLLELCFRSPLERQHWRTLYGPGASDKEREGFDVLAAIGWLREVADEAGPDYAAAVLWCLASHKTAPADRWREDMLREVVRPLQRCVDSFKLAECV
ncbi:hypothetical protein MCOR31_010685 [Pyricularia oryzae]|nr:hypothetical protein MCOR31_010685 [Pyricularia oryzae]KAI6637938.1 hypothetical protein MCOR14_004596 [Pyricularia oryzae]